MNFQFFEEIIGFAIEREEAAQKLYTDLAAKMDRPHICAVFGLILQNST